MKEINYTCKIFPAEINYSECNFEHNMRGDWGTHVYVYVYVRRNVMVRLG
jgi:hypothetical protein